MKMAQSKPERLSVQELLRLVDQLSPEEQEELTEEMKLHWLRRELQKGEEELDRGDGIPAEQVIVELKARNKAIREKGAH
jgi:hypothetical protein